tara:strand:+ start:96 stop:518 length:423 start_codon:yes stop_codon:yes gene_type:complete
MENLAKAANSSASGIAVIYNKTILLAKRNEICYITGRPNIYGGYWSILGGTIDEGETPKECAVRELEEEAGICLDVKNVKFLKKIPEKKKDFFIHYCKINKFPKITLNEEHTEYGFFRIDTLSTFPSPIDPKIAKAIQEI